MIDAAVSLPVRGEPYFCRGEHTEAKLTNQPRPGEEVADRIRGSPGCKVPVPSPAPILKLSATLEVVGLGIGTVGRGTERENPRATMPTNTPTGRSNPGLVSHE